MIGTIARRLAAVCAAPAAEPLRHRLRILSKHHQGAAGQACAAPQALIICWLT